MGYGKALRNLVALALHVCYIDCVTVVGIFRVFGQELQLAMEKIRIIGLLRNRPGLDGGTVGKAVFTGSHIVMEGDRFPCFGMLQSDPQGGKFRFGIFGHGYVERGLSILLQGAGEVVKDRRRFYDLDWFGYRGKRSTLRNHVELHIVTTGDLESYGGPDVRYSSDRTPGC